MTYTIAPVEKDDLSTITTVQWSALRDNPLIQTLYPQGLTPKLADFTAASYERAITYPSVRMIKAVDDETGQIVAFAKWIVYGDTDPQSQQGGNEDRPVKEDQVVLEWSVGKTTAENSPPHCYTRALNDWNNIIATMRNGVISDRKHSCSSKPKHSLSCYFACYSMSLYVLDIIHTHPSQQAKGAGACLVQWGIDMADDAGAQCYVETSVAGYPLFQKLGFQNVTEMNLDLGRYKEGLSDYRHIVMVRPPFGLNQPERPPPAPPKGYEQPSTDTVEDISEAEENESPTLQYTAEARMLDLRSSNSTESPKVGSIGALRAFASTRDLSSSTSTSSRLNSLVDLRATPSSKDERSSLSPQGRSFHPKNFSMRDMGYTFSAEDLHKNSSKDLPQAAH